MSLIGVKSFKRHANTVQKDNQSISQSINQSIKSNQIEAPYVASESDRACYRRLQGVFTFTARRVYAMKKSSVFKIHLKVLRSLADLL